MQKKKMSGGLTDFEKPIVKRLLENGKRNQDITHLLNIGRETTVNQGRISDVRKDTSISPASDAELERYLLRQKSWDLNTGLNPFEPTHQRIWKAREAMMSAVSIFNNPQQLFKVESFCVNACVAWTYLLHHAFAIQKGCEPLGKNGNYIELSNMVTKDYAGLNQAQQENLKVIIEIRNDAVHKYLDPIEERIFDALFLSCAINFDYALKKIAGERASIAESLSFALHFSAPNLNNAKISLSENLPSHVSQKINSIVNPSDSALDDSDYQSAIHAQLIKGNSHNSHTRVIDTGQANGIAVVRLTPMNTTRKNATEVCEIVAKKHPGFNKTHHANAWKFFKVREKEPSTVTVKKYCWAQVHGKKILYTYDDAWVEKLIKELDADPDALKKWKP